jgi:hypothetical protein
MRSFFSRYRRGFTLADVLIAVTLTSILVILVTSFIGQTVTVTRYLSQHQQIRSESFAILNNTMSSLLREAIAIDCVRSNDRELFLFLDKFETEARTLHLRLVQESGEDRSQLVLTRGDQTIYLNSERTHIEDFELSYYPPFPSGTACSLEDRLFQPLVSMKLLSRHQRAEGARERDTFSFFEDPKVSFRTTYVLRNTSFSNSRSL